MLIMPLQSPDHSSDLLVVVFNKDNIERLQAFDPAEVILSRTGKVLVNPAIIIAFDDGSKEFTDLVNSGDVHAALKFLSRGFRYRPERGDTPVSNKPYPRISDMN